MKLLFALLIGMLILTGCQSEGDKLEQARKQSALDSLRVHAEDSIKQAAISRIREIKKKYKYPDFHFYDGLDGLNVYEVETTFNDRPSATIWLQILDNGEIYFASNFYAKKLIYHNSIRAEIGDTVISSQEIPHGTKGNIIDDITETIYINDKDNGILNKIAASRENDKITITLIGSDEFKYSLSKKDILKIKDVMELSRILKSVTLTVEEQKGIY